MSKYGRLFTEQDVLKIAQTFAAQSVDDLRPLDEARAAAYDRDLFDSVLTDLEHGGALTFPADEPVFVLRGQDALATWALQHYVTALRPAAPGHRIEWPRELPWPGREHREAAWKAWQAMVDWQEKHPDRVKAPD